MVIYMFWCYSLYLSCLLTLKVKKSTKSQGIETDKDWELDSSELPEGRWPCWNLHSSPATVSASFLCDSLLNQSLAWAHQMRWHCLIWSPCCNSKVGKGRRILNWTQMLQGNWSGYRDNPSSESTSVNSCDIYIPDAFVPFSYLEILCVSEACGI